MNGTALHAGPSMSDGGEPRPLVLYHGRCPDGFAAALAAWLVYRGEAEYCALEHGEVRTIADLPSLEGRVVYVLDFSFEAAILREIEQLAAKLVLLDHHRSAAEKLNGFVCRCGVIHFDMTKCGARLAWEFFHPGRVLPDLIRFIEDRDLWVWRHPDSPAFLAALDMEPQDFARWETIANFDAEALRAFVARGAAMHEKFHKLAEDIAQSASAVTFNGVTGLMVNAPGMFHSLVGDMLSARCGSFALMWSVAPGGVVKVGLRSQRNFNCIPLAEAMGGGGHAQACGFRMAVSQLPQLLSGVFDAGVPAGDENERDGGATQ